MNTTAVPHDPAYCDKYRHEGRIFCNQPHAVVDDLFADFDAKYGTRPTRYGPQECARCTKPINGGPDYCDECRFDIEAER